MLILFLSNIHFKSATLLIYVQYVDVGIDRLLAETKTHPYDIIIIKD